MPDRIRIMLVSALAYLLAMPLAVLAADSGSSPAKATSNFIDTITGYRELSTCAENALSTIVRAQSSGCGDGGALTSYTCFCTDSSSIFSSIITSAISESCSSPIQSEQASSAISVFDAYCALGVPAGLATTTAGTIHGRGYRVTLTGSNSIHNSSIGNLDARLGYLGRRIDKQFPDRCNRGWGCSALRCYSPSADRVSSLAKAQEKPEGEV
ncbi:hypothetical protein VMCG_05093 [Cytospora schulzeri]|uniref:Extracellular membrane protein CFEM domain-containing protein n=1 Tax=Cytospora schulzeri TaxID=448051 RepID=A0A423WLV6_9PEZI|nr:hypothetical protein VMCG_05093 [Valsa malicola]